MLIHGAQDSTASLEGFELVAGLVVDPSYWRRDILAPRRWVRLALECVAVSRAKPRSVVGNAFSSGP